MRPANEGHQVHTFVYKTVNGCPIRVDVYPVDGTTSSPILMCIHGGALIWGSRSDIASGGAARLRELCAAEGYTQVSIDYRLAPETKLPAIIDDIKAPGIGVTTNFLACSTSIRRASASSAARPAATSRSWPASVSTRAPARWFPCTGTATSQDPGTRSQALSTSRNLGSRPRTHTRSWGQTRLPNPVLDEERWRFYLYCRQRGIWIQEVTGLDPMTDSTSLRAYRPICNISRDYPATLLVHGTTDTDVPYQQSADMASALQAGGRAAELIAIPGGAHAFDEAITASDLASDAASPAARSFQQILGFLGTSLNEAAASR